MEYISLASRGTEGEEGLSSLCRTGLWALLGNSVICKGCWTASLCDDSLLPEPTSISVLSTLSACDITILAVKGAKWTLAKPFHEQGQVP